MKITVQTAEFQDALAKLLKVAVKKGTIPILEGIKVEARGSETTGYVKLTASDCEVLTDISLKEFRISDSGSMVFQKETIKLILKMKSNELIISNNKIVSGRMTINFVSLDAEDFPKFYVGATYNQHMFTLPKDRLLEIIDVRFACSTNEATTILTGVCFRGNQAIGCDRHRLAIKETSNELLKDAVVSAKALNLIPALADKKYKGTVMVWVDPDLELIRFEWDNITFQARLLEGTYPDVSRIIPKSSSSTITVNKSELLDELITLKEYTGEARMVKFKIKDDSLTLSVETADNKLDSELTVKQTGDNFTIAFDVNYLIEGLKHNSNESVTFAFTGKLTPAMIDNQYMVLPLRIAS